MKPILLALFAACTLSLSSCSAVYAEGEYGYEQYEYADNNSVSIVIQYGTPYYYQGHLWYYYYNGLYYYPFYYDGYWYLRPFNRLYSWDWYRGYIFRPSWRDRPYRFRPGHHGFDRPGGTHHGRPHEGYRPPRPRPDYNRSGGRRPGNNGGMRPHRPNPNSGSSVRPNNPPRPSTGNHGTRPTPPSRPNGNNGGMRPGRR